MWRKHPAPSPRLTRHPIARRRTLLRQLSVTHSVTAAARSVGMHRQSSYRLRAQLKGQTFDLACGIRAYCP